MEKNKRIASEVLRAVGGETNVTFVTHCITRLRFNLKDQSIPNDEEIKAIDGVIGVTKSAGQFHVVIGQNVQFVYKELIKLGNFNSENVKTDEKDKAPFTIKNLFSNILNVLAGCVTPLIPIMMAAAMFKMLVAVLGPSMLGVIVEESNVYTLLTFIGDAGFYFMPIFAGYTVARKMGANQMIGMLLGAILIHPTFISLVGSEVPFTVFGITIPVLNYSSSLLPIVLSVYVLTYVEMLLNKLIPNLLKTVLVPFLSVLIMIPIMFNVCGPIGGVIGDSISNFLLGLGNVPVIGVFAIALIGGLWQFLVITGMHQVLITSMIVIFVTNGFEGVVSPGATVASIAVSGMLLGSFLRIKDKKEKSLTFGYLVASFIGGVTEPGLYGNGMKFKRPFIGLFIGGFIGGLYASIFNVVSYNLVPVASFLAVTGFTGGSDENFIHGVIACAIGFVVAAIVTYFFGYNKNDTVLIEEI